MAEFDRYGAVKQADPEIYDLIRRQAEAERTTLKMIPSENFAPLAVLEATGSILTNKYCEGYPGKRYYEGNEVVDEVENLAITRLKKLFGAEHANVQPYSGSPANQAVHRALVRLGDKIMGLPVPQGGHLTHGWGVNFSGTDYVQIPYGVKVETGVVDFDAFVASARAERPKMIWVGGTSYPRIFDYARYKEVADEVKAYLVADIAHINGLIVGGVHPNPVPYCDVVSSTSHKMIRGPRGGFIMSRIEDRYQALYHADTKLNLAQRIDRMVFPHLQGGPHMNVIAAMAVTFQLADTEEFRQYARQVVANSRALAAELVRLGHHLVSGGTDNHLLVLDFRHCDYTGKDVAQALGRAGIIGNFNMVPGDPRKPFITSGVRLGTPGVTSMGMKEPQMLTIAKAIDTVCRHLGEETTIARVRGEVKELCSGFHVPGISDA